MELNIVDVYMNSISECIPNVAEFGFVYMNGLLTAIQARHSSR